MTATAALSLGLRRRLPVVIQAEAAECGLACLAMISSYHGHRCDLEALRRRFPLSLKGATLPTLITLAGRLELAARPVRLELAELKDLRCPCILHWDFNHFVVLKAVRGLTVTVHDPARGERRLTPREVARAFTGVALELWPNPGFRARDDRHQVKLRSLLGHVTGLYRSLGQILGLAAALEVFAILSPLFLQWVIDHALPSANRPLLTTLALGFALLVLVQQLVNALRAWVIMHFGATLNLQWHANTFAHLLRLPMQYFEKRHIGDIVSRFRSIDAIQHALSTTFVEAIVDGLMACVVLVLIFLYDPLLALIPLAAVALYGTVRWAWYRPLRLATEEQIVHMARQESHFLETVHGARPLKLFQRQDERRSGWLALMVEQVNAGLRTRKLEIAHRFAQGSLFGIENVLVVWLAARLILDGQFSVGMLTAFLAYKNQFSSRVGALIDKLVEIRMLKLHGQRLADIVLSEPEPEHDAGRLAMSGGGPRDAGIVVRGLRYRYSESEPYVLDGIDLEIRPGECVAIVGPSGCGKTTLLRLLLGMLTPVEGTVSIGGIDLRAADMAAVRRSLGSVMQNDTLFAGSIGDNITFFAQRPDQARVEHCAKLAAIHEEILALPMAYNTFAGYMGSALSGGQQQRILLARALYKQPRILLLDEATSHLDVKRELAIGRTLRGLDVTRVVIAHRPQTAATADRVITLEGGRIRRETRGNVAGDAGPARAFAYALSDA